MIQEGSNRSDLVKVLIPLAVYLVIVALPVPTGLTIIGWRSFALVVSGILTFSLQPISLPVAIPLFVLLAVPAGICKLNEAISSFMGPAFIFVFCMIGLAISFEKSGLTKRIAVMVAGYSGGSPRRLLFLVIATASLTSMVIADVPILVMLFPICQKIIETNGCNHKNSNFAQSLLLGAGSGCFLGGMGTPAGNAANPVSIQILQSTTGIHVSFIEWSAVGIPLVLALIPLLWLCLIIFLPSEISHLQGMEEIEKERKELGPITRREKIFLAVFIVTLIMWFLDFLTGIPVQVVSIISVAILALPGIKIFSWKEDSGRFNWEAIMLTGGATAFGFFLVKSGVTAWFAEGYLISLADLSLLPLYICIVGIMILTQFPIPASVGAVAALLPVFLTIANMKGLNPVAIMLAVGMGSAGPILSPAVVFYPIINATGLLKVSDVWRTGFPAAVCQLVCIILSIFVIGGILGFL